MATIRIPASTDYLTEREGARWYDGLALYVLIAVLAAVILAGAL